MEWPTDTDDEDHEAPGSERRRRRASAAEEQGRDAADDLQAQRPRVLKPALVCAAESVKVLVTLLSCLFQGKKDQRVRCDIDRDGLLFTSHSRGKSLQIKTSLDSELFESYRFDSHTDEKPVDGNAGESGEDLAGNETQYSFALNLNAFIECLSMFGPTALATSSVRLSYFPATANLTLVVEDNGVICECLMRVLELEGNDVDQLEFEAAFEESVVVSRCIMQSEPLHDAFAELYDLPSAATVTISMCDDAASNSGSNCCLRLSATSESGSCEIDFARSSTAFIEFFCIDNEDSGGEWAASFHVAVLQQAFKALAHSHETFLRMNASGFLSVQHMVESGTGDKAFIDALICPEDTSAT